MVLIIDSTDMDLGKHAYSQMRDFGTDAKVEKIEPLDTPRKIAKTEEKVLLILDTEVKFAEQIVGKVLDLEEEKHVEKVFLEKDNESRESLMRKAKSKTREKAEKIAEEES